jgi:oligopeptide transport system substrate-binding protein
MVFMRRHNPHHRAIFLSLLCLFALLVAACNSASPPQSNSRGNLAPAPASQQILRYPIGSSDFTSLDPALAQQVIDTFAIQLIFTGLVELNNDGTVIDQLATSHQISPDGLTYTFFLKPNLKFSDGTPLTANDAAYSINRALLPATKSTTVANLTIIKDYDKLATGKISTLIGDSIIVRDDHTISITLGQPAAYFLEALAALPTAYVVERKLIDKYGTQWTDHMNEGGGAGPFKVASYDHNKGLFLVPNPNFNGPEPRLQKVELLRSGDFATTYKGYLSGQYDFTQVPTADLAQARTRKDFRTAPALSIVFIAMNYQARPFDNIKIRQAFALATNKDLLARTVLHGSVIPTNHLLPQGVPGYNAALTGPAGVKSTAGDASKAKHLLQAGMQEEGYSSLSQLPAITLTYPSGDPDLANYTAALQQEWQTTLGVTVKLNLVDINAFIQMLSSTTGHAGPLQMWLLEIGNYPDPQGWLSFNFGTGAAYNNMNYGQNNSADVAQQRAVQAELLKADTNLNSQERIQQYNDAEQKLVNDVAWLPLYQAQFLILVNPKLQHYTQNSLNLIPPDEWSQMYMAQ